jgi:hypothetical protein
LPNCEELGGKRVAFVILPPTFPRYHNKHFLLVIPFLPFNKLFSLSHPLLVFIAPLKPQKKIEMKNCKTTPSGGSFRRVFSRFRESINVINIQLKKENIYVFSII